MHLSSYACPENLLVPKLKKVEPGEFSLRKLERNMKTPLINTPLPGPKASELIRADAEFVSPSYTRVYPLVVDEAQGLWVRDVDGNQFLDFTAGIAVNSTGHCHPEVVEAIRDQAGKLIHMSGTDFYYSPQIVSCRKAVPRLPT